MVIIKVKKFVKKTGKKETFYYIAENYTINEGGVMKRKVRYL
jgi:hypothetical protein